jgi:rubrerythrin
MFYSPIIRFKPVIQYKHHLFRKTFIMEKNTEKVKLNDEQLDQVSGGDYDIVAPKVPRDFTPGMYLCKLEKGGCGTIVYSDLLPDQCPICHAYFTVDYFNPNEVWDAPPS